MGFLSNHVGFTFSELMTDKGIPQHKHADMVKQILSISTPQAHRKVKDLSPWDLNQIEIMLNHLEVTITDFFALIENRSTIQHEANITVSGERMKCFFFSQQTRANKSMLSAIKINDQWEIISENDNIESNFKQDKIPIGLILIRPQKKQITIKRIAILDDDIEITKTISEHIYSKETKIDCFNNYDLLNSAIDNTEYHVYVLDWMIKDKNVFRLIEKIRNSEKPDPMIIVLTGQSGDMINDEISRAVTDFDIIGPFEKPLRLEIINSNIKKYLENL